MQIYHVVQKTIHLLSADGSISISIAMVEATGSSPTGDQCAQMVEGFLQLFLAEETVAVGVKFFENCP